MTHWNYRVLEFVDPTDDEPWQAIHEVYYDDDGNPDGYSEEPAAVVSSDADGNVAGLGWVLDKMREALSKPVLFEKDFPTPSPETSETKREPPPAMQFIGGEIGPCDNCGMPFMEHIAEDAFGRRNVCRPAPETSETKDGSQ